MQRPMDTVQSRKEWCDKLHTNDMQDASVFCDNMHLFLHTWASRFAPVIANAQV